MNPSRIARRDSVNQILPRGASHDRPKMPLLSPGMLSVRMTAALGSYMTMRPWFGFTPVYGVAPPSENHTLLSESTMMSSPRIEVGVRMSEPLKTHAKIPGGVYCGMLNDVKANALVMRFTWLWNSSFTHTLPPASRTMLSGTAFVPDDGGTSTCS